MAHSEGIITTVGSGISLRADIASVLGVNSGDLGTLCKSNNVNMWSKSKPIKYASWEDNGGGEEDSDGNPYGIYRPSHDDIAQISSSLIYWVKPTGGESSPYRTLDFDGYNHNCECPWSMLLPSGSFPLGNTGAVVKFLDKGDVLPDENIAIADLYPDMYFCVNIGGWYKTLGEDQSTLNISECPAYKNASAGTTLTIRCAMSTQEIGDPSDYTDWVSGGIDSMFYSLSYSGHPAESTITLYTPAQNTRGFTLIGIATADTRLLTPNATTNYIDGEYNNAYTQTGRLSKNYTLTSASVEAKLHGSSQIVDSYQLDVTDCLPSILERGDGGYPYTVGFSAPVNELALDLPIPAAGSYYDIRVVLTYA